MTFSRASGVLLHPTSLPGRFGIGDLGPSAHRFLDSLAQSRQGLWQVLPLGPTGYGNSPYQSLSALASNPRLVSPELLLEEGLLASGDLGSLSPARGARIDFAVVAPERDGLLRRAHARFRAGEGAAPAERRARFDAFRTAHGEWLRDFALFIAIKEAQGGRAWTQWPAALRLRERAALEQASREHAEAVEVAELAQFLAYDQWDRLHRRAHELGIAILGDVPIFVAHDSADVWSQRALFDLDEDGRPRAVAGVPPDYFSETGQLWGNPLFRWGVLSERGYDWWVSRMRHALTLFDRVRVDHFRGFQAAWEVPAGESTAVRGQWVEGPGRALFDAIAAGTGRALEELPIVAEDLGEITPEVLALRDALGFPGMRVLQFGFGEDPRNEMHAAHNFTKHCVAYTGTHDNDTTLGWFRGSGGDRRSSDDASAERTRVLRYLGTDGRAIHWDLIRILEQSVADTAIVPMQDILGLGSEARMNTPGRSDGNWEWRMSGDDDAIAGAGFEQLARITEAVGRSLPATAIASPDRAAAPDREADPPSPLATFGASPGDRLAPRTSAAHRRD